MPKKRKRRPCAQTAPIPRAPFAIDANVSQAQNHLFQKHLTNSAVGGILPTTAVTGEKTAVFSAFAKRETESCRLMRGAPHLCKRVTLREPRTERNLLSRLRRETPVSASGCIRTRRGRARESTAKQRWYRDFIALFFQKRGRFFICPRTKKGSFQCSQTPFSSPSSSS